MLPRPAILTVDTIDIGHKRAGVRNGAAPVGNQLLTIEMLEVLLKPQLIKSLLLISVIVGIGASLQHPIHLIVLIGQ